MPLLCGDDEKAYLAHISKRLKNKKEKYFHYRYYIQKADYWAAHGKRGKAEKLMWEKHDDENIRDHYIDSLIEWGEYKKAVEVIDDNKDDFHSYSKKWENKVVKALKLSGDKDWLIEECKKRFVVSGYRIKYYEALKEVIDRNEWPAFFDELWKMPDWEHDYEDAEAKILVKEERWICSSIYLCISIGTYGNCILNISNMYPRKTMPLWVRYYSRISRDWLCSKKSQRSSTGNRARNEKVCCCG